MAELTVAPTSVVTVTSDAKKGSGPPPPLSAFSTEASGPIAIKSVGLIFNPVSGNKMGKKRAEGIVKPMLEAAGVAVTMMPTERAGHAIDLAKGIDLDRYDALLALGGDGTLSDVASGYLQQLEAASSAPPKAVLGFIPGGTGNTVMHDFNGKRQKGDAAVRGAVEMLLKGHTRKLDCCKLECTGPEGTPLTRHSINIVTAGLGVDANAAAEKRRWMGPMRYDSGRGGIAPPRHHLCVTHTHTPPPPPSPFDAGTT